MMDLLFPHELAMLIYEYSDEYKIEFREKVLPDMLKKVGERMVRQMLTVWEKGFSQDVSDEMYVLLMSDAVNLRLIQYDQHFHRIDKMYFNHSILRRLWRESLNSNPLPPQNPTDTQNM